MDKLAADKLITEYTKKLFGFALSKTGNIDEAEELAAQTTLEVYSSLLRRNAVANVDGYVYRVARNVYARFIDGKRRGAHLSLDVDGMNVRSDEDFLQELINGETYSLLRREIAYLSKTQREIVVAHYYDRLNQNEIARRLNLSVGTVKWHLHEARNSLKEGITMKRELGSLGVKPIKFNTMGHSGSPGTLGDTSYFLAKRLTQNIAYAAYWEPKTVREIAEELGVSPLFVEDEVATLEEYGFMDRLAGDKLRTNIYITESPSAAFGDRTHEIYTKYAKILCEKYVPTLVDYLKNRDNSDLYIPDDDFNLLLWSVIPYAMGYKLLTDSNDGSDKYRVKRPDGGDYIAFAYVETDGETWGRLSYNTALYAACGNMTSGSAKDYPQASWQLDTYYDGRTGNWVNHKAEDFDYLYEFFTGRIDKTDTNIDKFRRLYEKGYLASDDTVNLIVVGFNEKTWKQDTDLIMNLPGMTDELRAIGAELDREIYELDAPLFPAHMQELCRAWSTDCLSNNATRTRVLEQLLISGVLTLPSENRKNGLCTLMFCDQLPK
ncbi:MAG: sigma-70 family RNA polymerase sigma factor [Oscillospiraceae bacterium]|jgi:RNA polymerase sigma factor (sigma-70 family)|nr:sigma-70 family RNA polymerase sigma factor [Oscillospiraceae bacterium]